MPTFLDKNALFIFRSDQYVYLDVTGKVVDGRPRVIQASFNIPWSTIDAALRWDDQTVFFFKGMDCVKYDLKQKSVAPGYPKKILFEWRGIWPSDLSDAIRIGSKVLFFRRTQYISYDIQLGKSDAGYPKPILDGWHGVWESIDGAEYLGQDKVLFFKDNQVIQYDLTRGRADAGYPVDIQSFLQSYARSNTLDSTDADLQTIRDYVSALMVVETMIATNYLSAIHNLQTTIQTDSPLDIKPNILSSILRAGLATAEKLIISSRNETTEVGLRPIVDWIRRVSDEIDKAADQTQPDAGMINEIRQLVTNACMSNQSGANLRVQMEDEYKQTDEDGHRRYVADIKQKMVAIQTIESLSVEKLELAMYTEWINQSFDGDRIDGTGHLYIQLADDGTLSLATARAPLGEKIAVALNAIMSKAGIARLAELDVVKKVCKGGVTVWFDKNNVVRRSTVPNEPIALVLDEAWQQVTQFSV